MKFDFREDKQGILENHFYAVVSSPNTYRADAIVTSGLYWVVNIFGQHKFQAEGITDFEDVSFENDCFIVPGNIRRLGDLIGKSITWNDGSSHYQEVSKPFLWTSRGGDIEYYPECTLSFLDRKGNDFHLACSGATRETQERNLDNLDINWWATFKGVDVHCNQEDDEQAIRKILTQYLEPDDFIQHPKYPAGSIAWFEPKV